MYLLIFIVVWLIVVDIISSVIVIMKKRKVDLFVFGGTLLRTVIAVIALARVAN